MGGDTCLVTRVMLRDRGLHLRHVHGDHAGQLGPARDLRLQHGPAHVRAQQVSVTRDTWRGVTRDTL